MSQECIAIFLSVIEGQHSLTSNTLGFNESLSITEESLFVWRCGVLKWVKLWLPYSEQWHDHNSGQRTGVFLEGMGFHHCWWKPIPMGQNWSFQSALLSYFWHDHWEHGYDLPRTLKLGRKQYLLSQQPIFEDWNLYWWSPSTIMRYKKYLLY